MELTELEHRTSILNKKRRSQPSKSKEVENILPFIDKDLDNIYKTSWNKLEKGQRLNRITLYLKQIIKENNLEEDKLKRLKNNIHNHIVNGKINKNTDVDYDSENCIIKSIKGLTIDVENNIYRISIEKSKKTKSSNKSKSNIDRLIKKD